MYDSPDLEAACQRRDALLEQLETVSPQAYDLLDEAFSDVWTQFLRLDVVTCDGMNSVLS
mgnify:CR=1 FL=1